MSARHPSKVFHPLRGGHLLLLSLVLSTVVPSVCHAANSTGQDTERAMRLLHANCFSCHNAEKHKGGLDLTERAAALKGGDDGAVVVPGKPNESRLLKALLPEADPHMPPKKQLSVNQIELVRRWIAAGVTWDQAVLAKASAQREVALENFSANWQP